MARKPIPGSDEGQWGDLLNAYLDVAHSGDGSLKEGSITEAQLSSTVRTKIDNAQSGTGVPSDESVTTAKIADSAVTNSKIAPSANIAQSKIAGLTADLAGKANTTHSHVTSDVTGLQTALDAKAASGHTHPAPSLELDDLSNVNTSGASSGQVLTWQGAQWAAADQTGGEGGGTSDHGALSGLSDDDHPQYLNNSRGDVRYYTKTQVDDALGTKSSTNHSHAAAAINSGVLDTARLGSGSADASKVLYGDGSWKDAPTGGSGTTNLGSTTTATNLVVTSSSGTNATLAGATTTDAGVLTATDKVKLNGIATGATANSSNATLLSRSNHTDTQAISTVSGLQTQLDSKAASNATVNLTGSQTVAGVKTFSSSPIVPTPSSNSQVANKAYVDSVVTGGAMGYVVLQSDEDESDLPQGTPEGTLVFRYDA